MNVIKVRFPSLVSIAQQRVQQIKNEQALNTLMTQLILTPDEATALQLLGVTAA